MKVKLVANDKHVQFSNVIIIKFATLSTNLDEMSVRQGEVRRQRTKQETMGLKGLSEQLAER